MAAVGLGSCFPRSENPDLGHPFSCRFVLLSQTRDLEHRFSCGCVLQSQTRDMGQRFCADLRFRTFWGCRTFGKDSREAEAPGRNYIAATKARRAEEEL